MTLLQWHNKQFFHCVVVAAGTEVVGAKLVPPPSWCPGLVPHSPISGYVTALAFFAIHFTDLPGEMGDAVGPASPIMFYSWEGDVGLNFLTGLKSKSATLGKCFK